MSRHQCLIYEGSPTKHLNALAVLIRQNLEEGRRCLFLNSPAMVAGMKYYLAAAGIDLIREVTRGSLELNSSVSHLVNGRFNAGRMITMLADAVELALADGYTGLFATGDMTWEFGEQNDFGRLLEYERALEELFRRTPELKGVCQYRVDTLPANAVRDGLLTHQSVCINETLARINPFYSPTADNVESSSISDEEITEMINRTAHA
jgi:hypothetical protein